MALGRTNISLATYQMGSDVAALAVYLSRLEERPNYVWLQGSRKHLADLKASIAEIEAVLDRLPKSITRNPHGDL